MAEHLTVDQVVVGSTPIAHPKYYGIPQQMVGVIPTICCGLTYLDSPLINLFHHPRRVADHHHALRHVPGHHRPSPDHRVLSDPHPRQ